MYSIVETCNETNGSSFYRLMLSKDCNKSMIDNFIGINMWCPYSSYFKYTYFQWISSLGAMEIVIMILKAYCSKVPLVHSEYLCILSDISAVLSTV